MFSEQERQELYNQECVHVLLLHTLTLYMRSHSHANHANSLLRCYSLEEGFKKVFLFHNYVIDTKISDRFWWYNGNIIKSVHTDYYYDKADPVTTN